MNKHIIVTTLLAVAVALPTWAEAPGLFKKKKKKTPVVAVDSLAKKKKKDALKPYASVITSKAKTQDGFFKVHFVDDKYYIEVPDSLFGRDILIVNRVVKAPVSRQHQKTGYPGDYLDEQVIRFEKGRANKLFIRMVSYMERSADSTGMMASVRNNNVLPILATLPYKSVRKDGDTQNYVAEISDYISDDNALFGLSAENKDEVGVSRMVKDASYIDTIKAFPTNLEIRTVRTFERKRSVATSALERLLSSLLGGGDTGPMTYELNTSMVLLAKEPMKARFCDERVGYFTVGYTNFDEPQGIDYQTIIARWRLEPKDEDKERYLKGELVEPKQPIVYYIDPATPKKWVPYLIQGVNDWQAAFEEAGFKNAIVAKEAPTDDPTWSLEDARHSAIVYKPSDIANASGPHVSDPRSGEILETHINWYHNVMSLLHNWYVVQAGAIDTAAQHPVFSDELMGQLIRFVSSHEVGHTLGLRHNFGSSATIPVEKLRDKAWVEANGHTPSIMDYARFNYVAQPEDNISHAGIFPRIGMYDKWAINYGYRWMPQYDTMEQEIPYLRKWVTDKLASDKRYVFGTELDRDDPRNQSECLGDDNMLASEYGIKNLKRILPHAIDWTYEPEQDYTKAVRLYQNVIRQFDYYMGHVTTNVAGIYHDDIIMGQPNGKAVTYVPKDIQRRAVDFLNRHLFITPTWLIDKQLVEKLGVSIDATIANLQGKTLNRLLDKRTFDKMTRNASVNGAKAYTADELFQDLSKTVWRDLNGGAKPDFTGRCLQKTYITALIGCLDKNGGAPSTSRVGGLTLVSSQMPSDAAAIARAELTRLRTRLKSASGSGIVKAHYQNLVALIDQAFDNK